MSDNTTTTTKVSLPEAPEAPSSPPAIAVIMAGGLGHRLWPRSREHRPKQFMPIIDENTLLQNAVGRLMPIFKAEHIYVVCPVAFLSLAQEQLPAVPVENFITEPFGRNTAACAQLATTVLRDRYTADTVLCIFPSDHLVTNVMAFQRSITAGITLANSSGGIVTIGITPTRPEKSFGYIQIDEPLELPDTPYECKTWSVMNFAEKPDVETAKRFVQAGDFLWNTGIFIWKMHVFQELCDKFLPDQVPLFRLLQKHLKSPTYDEIAETVYRQIRSISIDYAILEKADNRFVIEAEFGWSDVGSWDEVYNLLRKDEQDNAIRGNVIVMNSKNCFINGEEKLIALVGVEGLVVVDTAETLLICHRNDSQDVKEIVDFLRRKNIDKYL